jgi:hypothetical protein
MRSSEAASGTSLQRVQEVDSLVSEFMEVMLLLTSCSLRCIPKMDHHCPWTANCVSHTTFPHFIRFVFYAVAAMSYLEYFLFVRARHLWDNRALPSVCVLHDPCTMGLVTDFELTVPWPVPTSTRPSLHPHHCQLSHPIRPLHPPCPVLMVTGSQYHHD